LKFTTTFTTQRQVRFSDCDPAGIVFFPQYLVMLNGFVEEWFDQGLGISYANLIGVRRTGLPTVRLEVDFTAISHHGDVLSFSAGLEKLGRSSLIVLTEVHGVSASTPPLPELRLRARQVLVCTSLETHKPQALPDDVRSALTPYQLTAGATA
jgi:4-hydroxybenzoyl-CoA thioesterase